jgi:reactive intermediate/imine deaminase
MVKFYTTPEAKAAGLPFSLAVRVGDVLYLSGAMGNVPGKMELAPGGLEAETKQMFANIEAVLSDHGLGFGDVFKCTVMLADMGTWPTFNKIYLEHFDAEHLPARSAFGASGLAMGGAVEMECWAYKPQD